MSQAFRDGDPVDIKRWRGQGRVSRARTSDTAFDAFRFAPPTPTIIKKNARTASLHTRVKRTLEKLRQNIEMHLNEHATLLHNHTPRPPENLSE